MGRRASVQRTTKETDIKVEIDLDSPSKIEIQTGIGFFDHMLTLMSAHGQMGLEILAKGDLEVDSHHTVEDVGICVGQALKKALGDMKGINRYGQASIPMDEALASVTLDISNRPYLAYNVPVSAISSEFDAQVFKEFFRAFAQHAGITLHINVVYGENTHHILEAVFKGVGRALSQAAAINNRIEGVPSTKGVL